MNGIGEPLAVAARRGLTEAIKCLLKAGANPNASDMVSLLSSLSHNTISVSCLTCNSSSPTTITVAYDNHTDIVPERK